MFRIKTFNQISVKGLDRFGREHYEVGGDIAHPDAYLLRSHKLHGEEIPETLLAAARAGAGVNNIPIDEYTSRGVVVFNTPGANANAVKELVLAGLLLTTRGILPGLDYVQQQSSATPSAELSKQMEQEKKRFVGSELYGKTLGVVGLGTIGSMVADMALAMGMNVIGYDPAISVDAAWRLSSQVEKMENLQSLLAKSDYISLHVPAIEATHQLINSDALSSIRDGAVLLNFARESIVDPKAILSALANDKLRNYVCDFPEPEFIGHPKIIALPHIGASTLEAEENCAVMAANQLKDFLEHGNIVNSVNFPVVQMAPVGGYRLTFSNENVSGVLGDVLSLLADNQINVIDMMNKSRGNIAYNIIDIEQQPSEKVISAINAVEHVARVRLIPTG